MSKTAKAEQPPPLPQSIVVGLNAWNAKSKISNANFECLLNEQVNVNNGDSIFVKASYLDTRGTASNNIVLARDTEISLEYYFYWIHTFNACDPTGITTFSGDTKTELTQQVLVGQTIPQLFAANKAVSPNLPEPVPGYFTKNNTGINDADGLPYLVYQSADNVSIPPVIGPVALSNTIVPGTKYIITTDTGITTNWQFAGIPGASGNQLPPIVEPFTATANPDINVPPSAFLYSNIAPLPYIQYVITVLGNTDWQAIDPTLNGTPISVTNIQNGSSYVIDYPGNLDWTAWGAADNNQGTSFVADTTVNGAPPVFPLTLTNAFFQAQVQWFVGAVPFTSDDTFSAVLDMDPTTGIISAAEGGLAGAGQWLSDPDCYWVIPPAFFGFNRATWQAKPISFGDFFSFQNNGFLSDLLVGRTYTIQNYGTAIDPCVPPFTWNLVGNFPTTNSSNIVDGKAYQVTVRNCTLLQATYGGIVGDFFFPTSPAAIPPNYLPSLASIAQTWQYYDPQGFLIEPKPQIIATNNLLIFKNANGSPVWAPNSNLQYQGNPFAPYLGQTIYIFAYDPYTSLQTDPWLFSSTSFTANSITNATIIPGNSIPNYTGAFTIYYPTPSLLIELDPRITNSFVATASFTPISGGTVASVVPSYSLLSGVVQGEGSIYGTMYRGDPPAVGTVIKALARDPALPADTGGRASVIPLQNNSTIPYQYSGYVQSYVPPSTETIITPVKKKWKMTLKKGSYDPNNLAEIISRSMSRQRTKRVNNVKNGPLSGLQSTLNVPTDNIWNNTPSGDVWAQPTGLGSNTFYDSKNEKTYDYPSDPNYNIEPDDDDMPFLFVPAMNGTPLSGSSPDNLNDYIYAQIPHPNNNGLNSGTVRDKYYISLVPLLYDVFSISPTIPPTVSTDGYYTILPFYSQNSITQAQPDTGVSGILPIAFGATQTSLLYNNENNGLFSFNYLHSPILAFLSTATSELTEVTAHQYTTQSVSSNMNGTSFFTTQVDKKSGILLHKMEPQSFWRQLGFEPDNIVVDLEPANDRDIGFLLSLNEFNDRTTGGFSGASNIFNQTFHTKGSADQPSVPDTELLYLTAVPPTNPPTNQIDAFVGNLTIGTSYIITQAGDLQENVSPFITYGNENWSFIGGPDVTGQGSTVVGDTFTATATGFPLSGNGIDNSSWVTNIPPKVVPANTPAKTTTQLQNTYFEVTNTNPINAVTIPLSGDNAGHYLIEITGYNSIYLDEASKREIKSIVSSYYVTAGSFTSQPFPDSYNYFNYGEPISLSNIKVRILDPITREEVIGLGANSSVYLQINKLLTQQAVAQVEN